MKADPPVRVAICDDSPTYARGLTQFLEHDGDLRVVAVYSTARELLSALAELRCDLITMDLELPDSDGVGAIEEIMRSHPHPIVVLSTHAALGSRRAPAALAAGALDAIHKGELRLDSSGEASATELRRRIKRLARVPLKAKTSQAATGPIHNLDHGENGSAGARRAAVIGIGSSTGGPPALLALLSQLPADFPIPLLVVQHISAGFTEGLVRWLNDAVAIPVQLAANAQKTGPGVWFAPANAHLTLEPAFKLSLDHTTTVGPHRPSVDVLLTSLARVAGRNGVGVVLTGMGRDGAVGVAAIQAAGGLGVAQDAESSVVDGMPAAARRAGAQLSRAPKAIGALLGTFRAARSSS